MTIKKPSKSKILLVEPATQGKYPGIFKDFDKQYDLPYGLLAIASYLEKENINSKIISMDYEINRRNKSEKEILINELKRNNPLVVGFTSFTLQYENTKNLAKIVRQYNKNIKIVIGGHHAMHLPKEVLKTGLFDAVVIGEGEITFKKYLDCIFTEKPINKILGIAYKDENGKVFINPLRKRLEGHQIPTSNYSLLPEEMVKKTNIHLMASRGCPYNCAFCSRAEGYGRGVKVRPLESIEQEIKTLAKEYDHKYIGITDETLHARPNFNEFMSLLKNFHDRFHIEYVAWSRADLVLKYPETLKIMKNSGIVEFCIGAESGSPEVLKAMNKGITVDMISRALKLIKKAGIRTGTFWLIGHPGSSYKKEMKTKKLIQDLLKKRLSQFIEVDIFIPFPGSTASKDKRINWINPDFSRFNRSCEPVYSLENFSAKKIKKAYLEILDVLYSYHKNNADLKKEDYKIEYNKTKD